MPAPTEVETTAKNDLTSHPVLDAMRRFLSNDVNDALVIYGPWGVGKTFAWEKLFDEALRTGALTKKRYAYTSLFGIASLEALRAGIFENTNWLLEPNIENEETNELRRLGNLALDKFKKHKYALAAVPYIGKVVQDAGPFYFTTVRNQIICIDDVERRGAALSIQDVLGLISFLKEQRDCKLIVLLNDSELGTTKEEYDRNAEKVFDESLKFSPSPEEAAAIAISGEGEFDIALRRNTVLLGMNNIRVISKILRFAQALEPLLVEKKTPTIESARKSLVLFGWMKYQPNLAPSKDFVLDKYFRYSLSLEKHSLTDEEKTWRQLLTVYGFIGVDNVDKILLDSFEKGIIEEAALKEALEKADEDLEKSGRHSPLNAAWEFFREGFGDNEEEVAKRLIEGVRATKFISVGNLSATYNLLNKIGHEREASKMIDDFVKNKQMPNSYWELSEHYFDNERVPDYIQKAFNSKDRLVNTAPDMKSLLQALGSGDGYNPEEISFLAKRPDTEFVKVIDGSTGEELRRIINGALRFRKTNIESGSVEKQLAQKMLIALKTVAARSRINQLRAKNLAGVAFDDDLPE